MITYTNDTADTVKIQYREAGKFYGGASAENSSEDQIPFDEKLIAPGESFNFDGVMIGGARAMGYAPEILGTPEDFVPPTTWSRNPDGTPVPVENPNNSDPRA